MVYFQRFVSVGFHHGTTAHSGKLFSMQLAESECLATRKGYSFSIITRSSSLDFPSFF